MSQPQPSLPIALPAVLAIGFTGHRTLHDEAACRQRIMAVLQEKKTEFPGTLCGVSSVAAGADLLFAESCLSLDIPLRVLLPLPAEEFRQDFEPPVWARALAVMQQAISTDVVGSNESRTERYYECGLETVQRSQMLLALWDGEPARGLGGTAEIVEFSLRLGSLVVWIHSVTGVVETHNVHELETLTHDRELEFLNGLPAMEVSAQSRVHDLNGPGHNGAGLAEAWLAKLDANAVRVAPQVRRLAALPIVCTALAAVLSGSAQHMPTPALWFGAGAGLGLVAALLPMALKLNGRQALWVRIRTAAEITRSTLALWNAPGSYQIVAPEMLPELRGMLASLNLLKSQTAQKGTGELDTFRTQYLHTRLIDQKEYFSRQAARSGAQGRRYRLIGKIAIASGVLITAAIFLTGSVFKTHYAHVGGYWLPLLTSALFQTATVAGALVVVHDCDRRQRRYDEIHRSLERWQTELEAFRTWHPVTQVTNRVERALLVELLEWRSLLQNMKMPRN